jgi:uncharacterized protein (DUF2141 family)
MEKTLKLVSAIALVLCCHACARQGAPTGGPKDTTPPGIDTLGSSPNFATRSNPRRLELKFDEWITLSDVPAQVVVSPPLAKKPEVTLRGKKVLVAFDEAEQFRENTTYTINFGTAVKDLHEGNPAKDLRFVFSTGDFIDSLNLKGRIVDAFTGEPIDNIAVMLYDNLADSVVRKDRPYYFSRTDKTGVYDIKNLKSGAFKVAAVEDLDQNLRWDGENERIGFVDTAVTIHDSLRGLVVMRLFKNPPKFRVIEKNAGSYGVIRLKYNASSDSAVLQPEPLPGLLVRYEKMTDSMLVWYDLSTPSAWKLMVNQDTIPVKELSREDFLKKHQLRLAADVPASAGGRKIQPAANPAAAAPVPVLVKTQTQNPLKPAVFGFNFPVVGTDTSKWLLSVDSLPVVNFTVRLDSLSPRTVRLEHNWVLGKTYTLTMLPGAVTDMWQQTNADTIRRLLTVPADKQLGGLNLRLEGMVAGQNYVVQLLDGATLVEERLVQAQARDNKLQFEKLGVATYTARIIEDKNGNGRWDAGDYWAHKQPESIISKKLESLRANWEVEATLSLNTDGEPMQKKKG